MSWFASLTWNEAAGLLCTVFMGVVALSTIRPKRKNQRRSNVRVPRETLWTRTNKYHGSKT